MNNFLAYRPPRIAAFLVLVTLPLWYFSPAGTILYIPYQLIGTICIASGFVITMGAWLQFKKAQTAICPTADTSSLVTNGAYRICRNPMYLGMLLILGGIAFFMGAAQSFFAPAAFFIVMDKEFIPYEEEKLKKGFGDRFAGYMKQTRRWL